MTFIRGTSRNLQKRIAPNKAGDYADGRTIVKVVVSRDMDSEPLLEGWCNFNSTESHARQNSMRSCSCYHRKDGSASRLGHLKLLHPSSQQEIKKHESLFK
jgi:hypothetical protein